MLQEEFAACLAGSRSYGQTSAAPACPVIDGSGSVRAGFCTVVNAGLETEEI